MTYDEFINKCVTYLTSEGYLKQPEPLVIEGDTYYDEIWWFYNWKDSVTHKYLSSFNSVKIIEKTETTKNAVLSLINYDNRNGPNVYWNVAYAKDIEHFYNVKYETTTIVMTIENSEFHISRNETHSYNTHSYEQKYPSKSSRYWYDTSQGVGRRVSLWRYSETYPAVYDNIVFSTPPFSNTYDVYNYLLSGASDGDFSNQTVWNVYVDPRRADGDYLDPNIKISWHNELLDEFLNSGGDGGAFTVKVWGGIPKLRSDATGGMEVQTIELGLYDYSTGNMLTSYAGVYSDVNNTYGNDLIYELFHGKICYILFAVYRDGEQSSSLCYISCKNKVPDTSTTANIIDYGQVGESFGVLIDNKVDDVSIVNVSIGTGEDDNGANNDNDESMDTHNVANSMELLTAGLTSVYHVTSAKLNQLGRFIWTDDAMDDIKLLNNSPIQNIVSCKCIPFGVGSFTTKNIVLGNIDTGVLGDKVNENIGKVLIGSVNVTPPFNNFLSYGNYTSISIYLPYLGLRQLDTDKVMGKTLKVYYNVDCLSGNCVIELFSNNIKINEFSCNVSIDIALTSSNRAEIEKGYITSAIGGGVSLAAGNVMGALGSGLNASMQKYNYTQSGTCSGSAYTNISKNCYIIIEYPDLIDNNSYKHTKGKPCEKRKRIGNCKGFTTISNVDLQIKATETELNTIKELLSSGIYL